MMKITENSLLPHERKRRGVPTVSHSNRAKIQPPPNRRDWIGKQVGWLTVLFYTGEGNWICKCRCGILTQRTTNTLKITTKGGMDYTPKCFKCFKRGTTSPFNRPIKVDPKYMAKTKIGQEPK